MQKLLFATKNSKHRARIWLRNISFFWKDISFFLLLIDLLRKCLKEVCQTPVGCFLLLQDMVNHCRPGTTCMYSYGFIIFLNLASVISFPGFWNWLTATGADGNLKRKIEPVQSNIQIILEIQTHLVISTLTLEFQGALEKKTFCSSCQSCLIGGTF